MERVLLTGVDTMIGSNLAQAWKARYAVLGLYDQFAVQCAGLQTAGWDSSQPASLRPHLERWQPKRLVHCGPLAASAWELPAAPHRFSHEPAVVAELANLVAEHGCHLTVLSSDAVFCGPRMFQDECCQPMATSQRGIHGRALECALEGTCALVVRSHVYGWNLAGGEPSFVQRVSQSLRRGQTPECDGRRYATPILASDLAELLGGAHEAGLRGLYHLAGAERTSMHRFVSELAASLGVESPLAIADGDPHAVEETSLSSKRARRELAASTPMLRPGLERFAAQIDGSWRSAWNAEPERRVPQEAAA